MSDVLPKCVVLKDGNDLSDGVLINHRDRYEFEQTTGPMRLKLGPSSGHVSLMKALLAELDEPFTILYILDPSRTEAQVGRYQSPMDLDRFAVYSFLDEYSEYFEQDGRHEIWVYSETQQATLVYDRHEIIYAYGPLDRFERVAKARGLLPGPVQVTAPHCHHYHNQFDDHQDRVMAHFEWIHSELREEDEG